MPLWIGIAGVVLWKTARVWLTDEPLTVRLGLAILAAVLVNPHLIIYDAAILVLPLIWFGAWVVNRGVDGEPAWFGALVYGLILTFLAPTATVIRMQLSVLLMLLLFWSVQQRAGKL